MCQLGSGQHSNHIPTGIVMRQDQIIQECKEQIEELQTARIRHNFVIKGIIVGEDMTIETAISNFFKKVLKIKQTIELEDAYKLGKSKNPLILIKLAKHKDIGVIFKNIKHLKNVVNSNNKPYRIDEQMIPRCRATRNRHKKLMYNNYQETGGNKLSMKFKRDQLEVEGKIYKKAVKTPSTADMLKASLKSKMDAAAYPIAKGEPAIVETSEFIRYSADVKSIADVNKAYFKVKSMHSAVRHVVCAFHIPHEHFHTFQDYCDDDEHEAGAKLLQMLVDSDITNRAVFVVRLYDGKHIGPQRFEAMVKTVRSAIIRSPHNVVNGENQYPWSNLPDAAVKAMAGRQQEQQHQEKQADDLETSSNPNTETRTNIII